MEERHSRTKMVIGEQGLKKLAEAHVAVFGIGGVGGYAIEALARGGIGRLTIVDKDVVSVSNLNRQLVADMTTIGKPKTEVMCERLQAIAPECKVQIQNLFYLPETADQLHMRDYDYVIDAVDTVTAKMELISRCKESGTPIICCMGTGNKTDPTAFEVADIYQTSICPLARIIRRECKSRGITQLKVVYSTEVPISTGERTPGSVSFVPGVAGLILAGEVIKDLIK